mgnify:CR=1 FL=1
MNDLARDILVKAALAGDLQIQGRWHAADGDCALGRLHLEMHQTLEEAHRCYFRRTNSELPRHACLERMWILFGISHDVKTCPVCGIPAPELTVIAEHMNDRHSLTFLDIARKAP